MDDDYPTEEELNRIASWSLDDLSGLWTEIGRLWKWPDWGLKIEGGMWRLATGGWSGNEDIVGALEANTMFWFMFWQRSERGGLHWFKPPSRSQQKRLQAQDPSASLQAPSP